MSEPLVLGIDGGGSKTLLALVDRTGRLIRLASGEGVNPMDNPRWRENLMAPIRSFAGQPGLAALAAALPVYGEVAALSTALEGAVAEACPGVRQRVLNDVDAAQIGAFAGKPGILVLSGTGSMAWARDAQGQSSRVGGWGDLIGDEGAAYWIGLRILSRVSPSIDGRAPPTRLVDAVFEGLGLDPADPMNALGGWVSGLAHARSGIAGLAPFATRLADQGDAGATEIVEAAAYELARHVTTIAARIGPGIGWSYGGGTLSSPVLRAALARRIGSAPAEPRLPPIGGVVLAAAELAGWSTGDAFIDRLGSSLSEATTKTEREHQD